MNVSKNRAEGWQADLGAFLNASWMLLGIAAQHPHGLLDGEESVADQRWAQASGKTIFPPALN